jgi:hypothetical protein
MIKPSKEFELLSRWALSLLDPGDFLAILIDDKAIEILLGKTTYSP